MLWLNTAKGTVIEAPSRPSPAWVVVVEVEIGGGIYDSTLDGVKNALLNADVKPVSRRDMDSIGKTGLDVFQHEVYWKDALKTAGFPYIITKIASDGTLEIRYDENAKDSSKDAIRPQGVTKSDPNLKVGGGRQTSGKSGQKGGPPTPVDSPDPDGFPIDEPADEPIDEPSDTPSDEPPIAPSDEERDAYKEGQDNADKVSKDLKDKMKEKMQGKGKQPDSKGEPTSEGKPADESGPSSGPAPDGSEGGAPSQDPTGEAGKGTGDGEGTPSDGQGGQGEGDSQGGQGQGDSDSDGSGEGGDGDADGGEGQGEGEGDGDGEGEGEGEGGKGPCDTCGE